jgi:hypothetical protein
MKRLLPLLSLLVASACSGSSEGVDSNAGNTTEAGDAGNTIVSGDAARGVVVIEGQSFSIEGTVAVVQSWPLGCVQADAGPWETACTGETLRVFMVNSGGVTCGYLDAHPAALFGHVPGLLTAEIDFTNVNGPVQPGDYEILTVGQVGEAGLPGGTSAFVQFNVTSAMCDTTSYANANGKATLTSFTSTTATGSYALTFPGPVQFNGPLSATVCNDPGAGSGGGVCASP